LIHWCRFEYPFDEPEDDDEAAATAAQIAAEAATAAIPRVSKEVGSAPHKHQTVAALREAENTLSLCDRAAVARHASGYA